MALEFYFVFCICSKVNILERIDINQETAACQAVVSNNELTFFQGKSSGMFAGWLAAGPGDQ